MRAAVPGVRLGYQVTTVAALDRVAPRLGPAGLVLGFDARQRPVTLRVHGGETTRVVLVGGLRCAQLLAMRMAGMGLDVMVRSRRPAAWEALALAVGAPLRLAPAGGGAATPAGRVPPAVIVDTGPVTGSAAPPPEPSRVALLLREELTTWDAGALTWADVTLLQSLTEAEATLAAKALGIDHAREALSRLPEDEAALACQGTVQRVRLRPTPAELDLIGPPARR